MCIADRNGNFLRLNRIWESTLGYRLNELEGANCLDYIHPEDLEATLSIRKILLTGSELQGFINRYRCKNGSYRWLEWHSTLYQSNLVFSVARDITERLQKDELRLAEILKQRDALVREVHHRIKNNLQGVVGLLRLYAAEHTAIKDIIEVVIGRIFSIAVIHGLQAGSASEEVDLSRLVEHITQTSVPDLEIENNLSFPVLINRDDAVSVALALNELLTNAIKHRNPEMPIKISLDEVESAIHFHISNAKNTKPITAPRKGNGLHLVKSILPPKSARFKISETENTFGARLILSPPTIIMQKNGLSGSKNSD
jgi:PAS domain S-box-containing protein